MKLDDDIALMKQLIQQKPKVRFFEQDCLGCGDTVMLIITSYAEPEACPYCHTTLKDEDDFVPVPSIEESIENVLSEIETYRADPEDHIQETRLADAAIDLNDSIMLKRYIKEQ